MVLETVTENIMTIDRLCCISDQSHSPRKGYDLEMQQSSRSFKLLVHDGNAPAEDQPFPKLLSLNRMTVNCG